MICTNTGDLQFCDYMNVRSSTNLLKVLKPSLLPALVLPLVESLLFKTGMGTNTSWFHLSRTCK